MISLRTLQRQPGADLLRHCTPVNFGCDRHIVHGEAQVDRQVSFFVRAPPWFLTSSQLSQVSIWSGGLGKISALSVIFELGMVVCADPVHLGHGWSGPIRIKIYCGSKPAGF